MRRSKSNPAKYAKHYRKISQRRMTDVDDDEQTTQVELKRIDALLSQQEEDKDTMPTSEKQSRSKNQEPPSEQQLVVLSNELLEGGAYNDTEAYGVSQDASNALILQPKRKKKKKTTTAAVQLSPAEIKAAKLQRKQLTRKRAQLAQRAAQKEQRTAVYEQLHKSAVVLDDVKHMLRRSGTLGQTDSTQQRLQRAKQKETAGIALTAEEEDLLYRPGKKKRGRTMEDGDDDDGESDTSEDKISKEELKKAPLDKRRKCQPAEGGSEKKKTNESSSSVTPPKKTQRQPAAEPVAPASLAAQMMASFNTLKQNNGAAATAKQQKSLEEEIEKNPNPLRKHYTPSEPIALKTTPSFSTAPAPPQQNPNIQHATIHRPPDVVAVRNELPVVAMELEVMDAIQQHDVVILCAETGSGKSTQVPQFLYERGGATNDKTHVAITQPRRVAAVATANRVAYELLGLPTIPRKTTCPVAYTTRYESAGLGGDVQNRITFMTDGILLQEIRRDLLLRKYTTVILDEAHERNLNTDVLIGLLRLAIPLRKQAAAELKPLKVVVMSATLRVQDFTGIFPDAAIVQVPGRTHSVSIHHAKETELDKYGMKLKTFDFSPLTPFFVVAEDVVFNKTCKIHQKLPPGGVLVFLTGKQEIVRMVRRLEWSLNGDSRSPSFIEANDPGDDPESGKLRDEEHPRDMDDDEVDGDLYATNETTDEIELEPKGELNHSESTRGAPLKAHILPLYSLLASEEQAKVFASVPEGHRLIVVATNIAETSLTIPGIAYVVDSGRQKSLNYSNNGVASYDITWISQAAADQRAGRAGRTGPGHCYRVYSSSLYSRHMDKYEVPEVLSRPLEDVVLSMKALGASNIAEFPFPTPPDRDQVQAAVKLLANLGCLDLTNPRFEDGEITRLGRSVSTLPLGVRHGKILLVAAEAGVVDFAIVLIAILSESTNPFVVNGQGATVHPEKAADEEGKDEEDDPPPKPKKSRIWKHKDGDLLAAMQAVGAYSFAGRGAGGAAERLACRKFCAENGLHPVVMHRIQTMRRHLAKLVKARLQNVHGVAPRTGKFVSNMKPPTLTQTDLLRQSTASGLLDNVAMLAPLGSIPGDHPYSLRSAYISCSSHGKEPLFMDRNSVLYSRDARQLPKWICYETLTRKALKDGSPVAIMKRITPINPTWLGKIASGSELLSLGEPIPAPPPVYNKAIDAIQCSVRTKFGQYGWEISPVRKDMYSALQSGKSLHFGPDDSFRWFARYLLEGKVLEELSGVADLIGDPPSTITQQRSSTKVSLLVAALSSEGIDTADELCKHWVTTNDKFLFGVMKRWVDKDMADAFQRQWIACVKINKRRWISEQQQKHE